MKLGLTLFFSALTYVSHWFCIQVFVKQELQLFVCESSSFNKLSPPNVWACIFINPITNFSQQRLVLAVSN